MNDFQATQIAAADSSGMALLDTQRAAHYVGLSASTMAKLRLSGDGPPYFKLGRRVMYARGDIEAWLASCRRKSTSDPGGAV